MDKRIEEDDLLDLFAEEGFDYWPPAPSQMVLRTLYLPTGTQMDLDHAKEMAAAFVSGSDDDEMENLILNYEFGNNHRAWMNGMRRWTGPHQDRQALDLLMIIDLEQRLTSLANTLNGSDPGVAIQALGPLTAYHTGGMTNGEQYPTYAYGMWDVVMQDSELLPEEWLLALAQASGFITPLERGNWTGHTVPFYQVQ